MSFFYNSDSDDSTLAQWGDYILNRSPRYYVNNITDAIGRSTAAICGTLENGFSQVNAQLGAANEKLTEINEGINNLHAMLDWKTDLILEQQRISNVYMGNMARLLQIPDSQKQRGYHVEQGLVYLKNAIEEGTKSAFYNDAIEEFWEAQAIEEKDFFTLHRLGLIHLNATAHLDVPKAENYFATSARYAKAFATAQPVNSQSILNDKNVEKSYNTVFTKQTLYEDAATSLIYASRCCYILQRFAEGLAYAEEAYRLAPHAPEAGLQLAKMLAVTNNAAKAADILEKVIELNRYYSVKALADHDLISRPQIQARLNDIANRALKEAKGKYTECKNTIIPGSAARAELDAVQQSLGTNDFLGAKKALDLLNEEKERTIIQCGIDKQTVYKKPTERPLYQDEVVTHCSLPEYIHEEARQAKYKEELLAYIAADLRAQKEAQARKQVRRWTIRLAVTVVVFLLVALLGLNKPIGYWGMLQLELTNYAGLGILVGVFVFMKFGVEKLLGKWWY